MREAPVLVRPRPTLAAGDQAKLRNGVRRWTVRGVTTAGRFVILTQPFNLQRTVLYTIVDFDWGIRGRDNFYGLGYETDGQVAAALHEFQHTEAGDTRVGTRDCPGQEFCRGGAEVSHRSGNHVRLDFESINGIPTDMFGRHIGGA
jgi:hypothetical protein